MRLAQLAVCAAALSAAGCGASGGPPPTPHVGLSISAPTSGATVGVHKVTIIGTVSPAGAQVVVNGQPAKVTGSSFTRTLYVASADQKIVVSGAAHGYVGSQASTTVSYSPNVAQQLVAAAASANGPAPSAASTKVSSSVIAQAFGLPATTGLSQSGPTVGDAHTTPVSNSSTKSSHPSTPSSPAPTNSTPSNGGAAPTSSTTTPPASTPAPPPTPAEIAAAIHDAWVHGCVHVEAGGSVVAYCTCTYDRLASQLQTRAGAEHVLKAMVPYLRSGDFRKVPRDIRNAVDACASKLPPLTPVSGSPVVKKLPGVQHSAAPAAAQGTPTDPTTTPPAPVPPAPIPVAPAPATSTPTAPTPVTPVPSLRSALQQVADAMVDKRPVARLQSAPHRHQGLPEARIVARALGYALVWAGQHPQSGAFPYGRGVQQRLDRHLSAALKLAA